MVAPYDIRRVRNIGIIAHIDAGKTTLTERILFYAGKIHKMGEVHEGTTEMDWMDQERERGITITAATTTIFWREHQINIVDTPGHVDFTAEVERSLRVLDGAIVIFSGVEGVESQSETVWRQADRYRVPRLAFINKLDRPEADFVRAFRDIGEKLGAVALPLVYPWCDSEGNLLGMLDLLRFQAVRWDPTTQGREFLFLPIPKEMEEEAWTWREHLWERLSEISDEIAELYLVGKEIPRELALRVLRKATIQHLWVPVFGGSAFEKIGVQLVMDAIVELLPSPLDVPPAQGVAPGGKTEVRRPSAEEPFSALVFKVFTDPYADRLLYTRLYSGTLREGETVLNVTQGTLARVMRIFRLHAYKREPMERAQAGDIVGLILSAPAFTGNTLCDPAHPLLFEPIEFPEPVVFLAVEPRLERDEPALREALEKLAHEDPTFKVQEDKDTGQILVGGMGELHLEVLLRRVQEEFRVPHRVGKPQVVYKETLARPVEVVEEFERDVGGKPHYAWIRVKFEPLPRGAGFEFRSEAEELPPNFVEAVRRGIQGALVASPVGGFPVTDVGAVLVEGRFRPLISTEVAFEAAGTQALRRALEEGGVLLLEPVAEGDIITPSEYLGEVVSDLGRRRGEIRAIQTRGKVDIVRCTLPVVETFGYATRLRSLTQGRAVHTLRVARYEVVPEDLAREQLRSRGYG
ncbi:MAG: elongation factor G [Candidatus Bipolaricaulaceae bacterium]